MDSPLDIATIIRFQLDRLSAQNAHHEFEHLCRHLVRNRICSNILPATGPVAAGGDQGRDFETFRTYLSHSPLANSTFLGLASGQTLVFACSLNKKIEPKIRSDVKAIAETGEPVDGVHYFCTNDIVVGTRHSLQEWAKESYGIYLEIHDGNSIAELLSDSEIFWIASRYLDVPSDLFPSTPQSETENRYADARKTWEDDKSTPPSFANYELLRYATRRAVFDPDHRSDLAFWIERLERLVTSDISDLLKLRATYELAVASLRGMGTMEDVEHHLDWYFDEAIPSDHASILEDAAVLISYCRGAILHAATSLTESQVNRWHDKLLPELDSKLGSSPGPNYQAQILETRGFAALRIESGRLSGVSECIQHWIDLTDLIARAPLFPLERFANRLTEYIPMIGDHPEFTELTQRVDELLSSRVGKGAAAEKSRNRAMAFYRSGRILRAIRELHVAKVQWYAEETLRGSVLSMMFIAKCYGELHLEFAAKYYWIAATVVAHRSENPSIRRYLFPTLTAVSENEYRLGNWYGFMHFADLAMLAHGHYSYEAGNFEVHPELERLLFHSSHVLASSSVLESDLGSIAQCTVSKWGLDDYFDDLVPLAMEMWQEKDLGEVISSIEQQLVGPLYGDLAPMRRATWRQLGVKWNLEWSNDHATNQRAEQLAAILQIVIADMAHQDLFLLQTTIDVTIVIDDRQDADVRHAPSKDSSRWSILLPTKRSTSEDLVVEGMSIATALLRDVSLMPEQPLMDRIEECFKDGIAAKIIVGLPFEDLYQELIEPEVINSRPSLPTELEDRRSTFDSPVHSELDWVAEDMIDYSKGEAHKDIQRRYDESLRLFPITIQRLRTDNGFRAVLRNLREQGWLDWHVLLAIANIILNYRLGSHQSANVSIEELKRRSNQIQSTPETSMTAITPVSTFSEEAMKQALELSMVSTLQIIGLECHQRAPDLRAIREFLIRRCHYWSADVPHDDVFPVEG